jgi:hypothetical protein
MILVISHSVHHINIIFFLPKGRLSGSELVKMRYQMTEATVTICHLDPLMSLLVSGMSGRGYVYEVMANIAKITKYVVQQ